MQLELIGLTIQIISVVITIISGVAIAIFTVRYTKREEEKTRVKAFRKKLLSEIALFEKTCTTFVEKTGREPDSADVVKNLALRTAQSIMDSFRMHPETKDGLPRDFLKTFLEELVLLAVKGFGDAYWFLNHVIKLKEMASEAVIEKIPE